MSEYNRLALVVSDAPRAQEAAEREFRSVTDWVPLEEADALQRLSNSKGTNTGVKT